MERQKSILGRKKRAGPTTIPGDFIALGSKQVKEGEVKRPPSPTSISRKKEAPTIPLASGSAPKKPKLAATGLGSLGRPFGDGLSSLTSGNIPQYDEIAVTVEPTELLSSILSADELMNDERAEALICGAVKHLRSNRSKPDQIVYLTLMYLSKSRPALFCTEIIIEAFCGLLKRELALTFKAKGNPAVSVLACNVLLNAFADEESWPDNFVKVFVEDSLGERVWVDRDDCRGFVDNILTAFGTKKSSKHLLMTTVEALRGEPAGSSSPASVATDDEDPSKVGDGGDADRSSSVATAPRYPYQQSVIEAYILETVREILNRRQAIDSSSRNLIRLMTSTCGYGEVRSMAAQRIDMWLQNPKLTRVSQDLLLAVCTNCDKHDQMDLDVIAHLTKMRMKTKPLINHYLNCIRELLSQHPDNLRMILNHTIYNELSQSRNPHNMPLIGVVFSHSPEPAAKILAEIFQDLLTNKDDYLRALRPLLREVVRCTRLDFNFPNFCLGLMQERTEQKFTEMDNALKERYVIFIADLISMTVLLSVSPNVREAASSLLQGDIKNLELIHVFKRQLSVIQRDAVWWLHMVVPKIIDLKTDTYLHCLKKVLFLEAAEQYCIKDNWPPESERGLILKLAMEAPVLEDTLMRLLVIGLLRELPLSAPDAVELVDQLVCRAAAVHYDLRLEVLQMERLEFFEALLNLCVYKHPENIVLPQGYTPPNLAITGLMWKAWLTLLILTAFNPSVFGETAWQKYPALQFLMEMVMTNNYSFPPPTTATDEKMAEEFRARERQIRQQEIQLILEFETHLAAATSKMAITESTSLLIGQLINNDPIGPARIPSVEVIEQLKTLNNNLKLGQMLCRSRNPDFLLRIINRQGTSQSMPWLAELVESSEGSLDVLPVQCLCEFLLQEPTEAEMEDLFGLDKAKMKEKNSKHQQLLMRLKELVHSSTSESHTVKEVLDYFLQRLASVQALTRQQAAKGLSLVLAPPDPDNAMEIDSAQPSTEEWLLIHLPNLPLFHEVKDSLCLALRKACQVETDPEKINAYIIFLSEYGVDLSQQNWNDMAVDMAQLLVERTPIVNYILPELGNKAKSEKERQTLSAFIKIFVQYMRVARKEDKDTFSWSNTQDQILLKWDSGQSATVHVLVVHAMIVLLTFGKPREEAKHADNKNFRELFDMWIQENNKMPSGYLLDTSEEALLLPDWLKLRMLRSQDDRLVSAALQEVEPSQLVLFVQSFGIPTSSMNRLLSALDTAVGSDPAPILEAVQDTNYMAKLVEIQHSRGAKKGKAFYRMITQGNEIPTSEDNAEEDEEMKEEDSWNMKGSGEPMLPASVDKLARLLDQIFSESSAKEGGVAKLFQSVLHAISTDKTKTAAILKAFDQLLSSAKKEAFAKKVLAATFRSCPIFKILIAKQTDFHKELLPVVEKLHGFVQGQKSMLTAILTQFLASQSKGRQSGKSASKQTEAFVEKCIKKPEAIDSNKFVEGLKNLKEPGKTEKVVQQVMDSLRSQGQTVAGTKLACSILSREDSSPMTKSAATLLTDWLSLLDPEVIKCSPHLEDQLLFAQRVTGGEQPDSSKGSGKDFQRGVPSQAHLLAQLTHQSSWSTLTKCLAQLLKPDRITELGATSVLDFVWACGHIPKIWQGREKITPKVEQVEDVLALTPTETATLVQFVLEEAFSLAERVSTERGSVTQRSPMIQKSRMDLLLSCICEDIERVVAIVAQLQTLYTETSGLKRECIVAVATGLYLQFPYLQAWLSEDSPLLAHLVNSTAIQSQMDIVSHQLISTLCHTKAGKQAHSKIFDANIACRKMAAHHPAIFLRQLPLLGAMLSGQSQYSLGAMKHNNQLQLFTHALGLLELLQPHVFDEQHHSGFKHCLDAFFALMQTHGHEQKFLGPLVHKLVLILQNFLNCAPQQSHPILQEQLPLLSNLAFTYPDIFEVKALLTSLTLPRQSEPVMALGQQRHDRTQDLLATSGGYSMAQCAPLIRRLSMSDDVMSALRDLDELSKRKVDILAYFESQLQGLMLSSNDPCRGTAFTLVLRSLRHNPKTSTHFLSTFLECLGSDNPDIVTSALKNLGEFTALCQEEATTILQKAFNVGVKSSLDSSTYINEALQMLNLHSTTA